MESKKAPAIYSNVPCIIDISDVDVVSEAFYHFYSSTDRYFKQFSVLSSVKCFK